MITILFCRNEAYWWICDFSCSIPQKCV